MISNLARISIKDAGDATRKIRKLTIYRIEVLHVVLGSHFPKRQPVCFSGRNLGFLSILSSEWDPSVGWIPGIINALVHSFLLNSIVHKPCSGQQDGLAANFFKPGNPRACIHQGQRSDFPLRRFSSLPGVGWDNLRNEAAGQIIEFNYTQCKTTEDGRYLIPDDVFTIPVKSSIVETFAEMFESSSNVTSTTAKSINLSAGLQYDAVQISGTYSQEHSRIKSSQVKDDSVATRTQLRYHRYEASLQPGAPLHANFKSRLMSIAADLDRNTTQSARYNAQLLVRDYGTHALTSVIAGAGLAKTDFVHRSYVASHASDKKAITATASASFASTFQFGAAFKQSSGLSSDSSYQKNMTDSYITTHGGPILRPYNMTITEWVNGVDTEMVPMDRVGEPLSLLITEDNFPELPTPLRDLLEKYVLGAIEEYYEMNTVRGCTKRGSPNFSVSANFDDGSCLSTKLNTTFGGVYQTCSVTGHYVSLNPCDGLNEPNRVTKGHSCPSGYTAIKLHTGTKLGKRESTKTCTRCGFLWLKHCCHYNYFQAKAHFETTWCAASKTSPAYSSVLFGGIYSVTSPNLVTGTKGCPPKFYAQHIFQENKICLSDKLTLAKQHAVPFGGFTTCATGNPLALLDSEKTAASTTDDKTESSTWPKQCPEGFNQHLITIDNGCAIRYCIRTGSIKGIINTPIKRPPFLSKPESITQENVYVILNSEKTFKDGSRIVPRETFTKTMNSTNTKRPERPPTSMKSTSPPRDASPKQSLPSTAVTGIALLAILSLTNF